MIQLHILNPLDASHRVFGGVFGTATPAADDLHVNFKIDAGLKACSRLFETLPPEGIQIDADQVVTVTLPDEKMADAVKANLARALQTQWERQYQSLMDKASSQSMMVHALAAEQQTAREGIDRFVASLSGVAPYLVTVHLDDADVYTDEAGKRTIIVRGDFHTALNLGVGFAQAVPTTWGDFKHESFDATHQAPNAAQTQEESGSGEARFPSDCVAQLDVTIPLYLPTMPAPQELQAMLAVSMQTPLLKELIVHNAPFLVPNFDSMEVIEGEVWCYGDDDDDEDDGDEYDAPRG